MKTIWIPLLCLALTSGAFADIQPIGSLGNGELKEISFLPDGRILRVLANRIELADPNTNATITRFADRTERMGEVTVSVDGSRLAIVDVQRSPAKTVIEIWELASRRKVLRRTIPLSLYHTALNPDLTVLAGHIDDGVIRLWDIETGQSLGEIEWTEHPAFVRLAFSPDGRQLLSVNAYIWWDGPGHDIWETTIDTWDTTSHRRLWSHEQFVRITHVSYSPDSRWIVMADDNHQIWLWDAKLGTQRRNWPVPDYVRQMQFSSDSRRVYIAAGRSGSPRQPHRVSIWDIETGEQLKELGDETIYLKGFSISPDEKQAILWYIGGFLALWDIPHRLRLAFWTDGVSPRWGAVSPDGRYLVASAGAPVTIWNLRSQTLQKMIFPGERSFRRIAMSPTGHKFAVDQDPWIEIRDIRSGRIVSKVPNNRGSTPFVFSSDGKRIALGEGRGIEVYDIHNPEEPEKLIPKDLRDYISPRHIAFSADDRYLAVADWKEEAYLWKKKKGKYVHLYSWKIPASQIGDIAFEPKLENPALVVITNLDQLQVWELGEIGPKPSISFNASAPIRFVRGGVASTHFLSPRLPKQRDYLLVNKKGKLQIWDWTTQTPVTIPDIPKYFAANRDGSVVITRDGVSGQTRLWNIRSLLFPKLVRFGEVKRASLLPNFPNPLNPETWIPYQLTETARVRIQIYDVAGRLVRELDLGEKPAGGYLSQAEAAYWDGRNNMGEAVSSGMYFYTLEIGDYRTTRRMSVVR